MTIGIVLIALAISAVSFGVGWRVGADYEHERFVRGEVSVEQTEHGHVEVRRK